jgi:hypothetical protein
MFHRIFKGRVEMLVVNNRRTAQYTAESAFLANLALYTLRDVTTKT